MPTSEFEKKIHRWASLICCFGSYRCLVRVGSICNLLELDLQMPGQVWKHLQFVGYEFADTYPGVGSICNLLELDLQMPITKLILRILQQLRWDCFLCRKKSKMFSWTCGAYCAKI